MGNTVNDVIQYMDQLAPLKTALEWDNSGLLIGERDNPVKRILASLDCTDRAVDEAVSLGVDMIITHHPLIFNSIKSITSDTALGRRIIKLIRGRVALLCAHTNLDMAEGGVNDILFDALGLAEKSPLMPDGTDEAGLGRVGELSSPMRLEDLASFVGSRLRLKHTRYIGDPDTMIYKAGLLCGSGSAVKYFAAAAASGCQAYITGDIKYHDAQAALDLGLCLIDATHYASEAPVVEYLCGYLREGFPEMIIHAAKSSLGMEGQFGYND